MTSSEILDRWLALGCRVAFHLDRAAADDLDGVVCVIDDHGRVITDGRGATVEAAVKATEPTQIARVTASAAPPKAKPVDDWRTRNPMDVRPRSR